jgi:hypothetical protein
MATRAPTRISSHPSRGAADLSKGKTSPRDRIIKMFDISNLAVKETAIVELESVDGEALLDANGGQLSVTVPFLNMSKKAVRR